MSRIMTEPRSPLGTPATIGLQLMIFAAVGWVALQISAQIANVLVPVLVAVIITALLAPVVGWLDGRLPLNRHLLAAVVLVVFLGVAVGILVLTARVMINGVEELESGVLAGLDRLSEWLADGPLGLGSPSVTGMIENTSTWVDENVDLLASGAVQLGGSITAVIAGAVIALLSVLFFLGGGAQIVDWLIDRTPDARRGEVRAAAERVWTSIKAYSRSQLVVAAADAIGIALGAFFIGLPFVIPIGVLVFFTAFIPIIGALLSGAVAVLIALAFGGIGPALIMLAVVIVVQQLESDLLGPLLLGSAVRIHPWAVLVGVACATYVFGIVGALLAVPVMATIKAIFFPPKQDQPAARPSRTGRPHKPGRARPSAQSTSARNRSRRSKELFLST